MPGDLRITRPTDWTTSTMELRGLKKITESSAGTSTPSDRQRALDKILTWLGCGSAFNHDKAALRVKAFMVPSTCFAVTCTSRFRVSTYSRSGFREARSVV